MSLGLRKCFLAKKLHSSYEKQNIMETQQVSKKSCFSKPSEAITKTLPIEFTSRDEKMARLQGEKKLKQPCISENQSITFYAFEDFWSASASELEQFENECFDEFTRISSLDHDQPPIQQLFTNILSNVIKNRFNLVTIPSSEFFQLEDYKEKASRVLESELEAKFNELVFINDELQKEINNLKATIYCLEN